MIERLYTIRELSTSNVFPFKSDKIRQFIKEGKLKVIKFGYNKIMIPESSIDAFIAQFNDK